MLCLHDKNSSGPVGRILDRVVKQDTSLLWESSAMHNSSAVVWRRLPARVFLLFCSIFNYICSGEHSYSLMPLSLRLCYSTVAFVMVMVMVMAMEGFHCSS